MIMANMIRYRISMIIILAGLYLFAGRLSLLLAIPPGYATAIFPSSGIALAALLLFGNRLWPGIILGSYLLNLSLAQWPGLLTGGGVVAIVIACGAALQAWAGAALVRRFVGFPNNLVAERAIFKFYFLSGPVSCLISASIGTASLFVLGAINLESCLFSWWNWWVGDVIGIFIMTPIAFAALAHPRDLWRQRLFSVVPPLFVCTVVMIVVFFQVSGWEKRQQRDNFNDYTQTVADALQGNLRVYSVLLESTQRFLMSKSDIDFDQFSGFASDLVEHYKGIQAVAWSPLVKANERVAVESYMVSRGRAGFQFTDRDSDNRTISSVRADEYAPILFIEPFRNNELALGFNLNSSPIRKEALIKARDSGQAVATGRIRLVQGRLDQFGILLIRPVYHANLPLGTQDERRHAIRGYTLAVLRLHDILGGLLTDLDKKYIGLQVSDVQAENSEKTLFQSANWSGVPTRSMLTQTITIGVGGRNWAITFSPISHYYEIHRTRQAWFILAGGLLFTGLMGSVLLLITGQTVRVQKIVKERTEELSIILDNVIDGIVTVDSSCIIRSFNPAAAAIFGYGETEIVGQPLAVLLVESDKNELEDYINENGFGDSIINYLYSCETEGRRKDGTVFALDFAMSRSLQHAKPLFVGVVRDVTERNRMERLKNEFISTVSHELRTPLTSIRGVLSLIAGGALGAIPEQATKMISMALKNSVRLTSLINDLLDIDKLASGKMTLHLELQALMPLVRQSLDSIAAYGEQYNVSFCLVEEADVHVQVSEDRLVQVLVNFMSNAAKFSPSGSQVELAVRRLGEGAGHAVRVEVTDHGSGIQADFQEHIFEKFSQQDASNTKKKGGTGLGLAISKELIERMNGTIGFHSVEGKGTCFYFELPLQMRLQPVLESALNSA